jgi:hypothetical protein
VWSATFGVARVLGAVPKLWVRHLGRSRAETLTELCGGFAVAEETEGAEVVEVALTAAFGDRADVVGVPQAATRGDGSHSVEMQAGCTGGAARTFECVVGGDGVDLAGGADTTVASEDLIAEIARVGAKTPLVDTVVAAKGAAAFGEDFELAPTAERKTIGAEGQGLAGGAAAG